MLLQDISWVEAKERFAKNGLVIFPTGSLEEHGPHMPLGTDIYLSQDLAKMLGERLDCLVAPSVNYGYCPYHEDFAGTISIDHDILYPMYVSITEQLVKWGATHIIFLNGHGGNTPSLDRVTMKLRRDHGVLSLIADWWKIAAALNPDWSDKGHGGYVETSAMLYYHPDTVNMAQAREVRFTDLTPAVETAGIYAFRYKGITLPIRVKTADISEYGNYGADPRLSSPKLGKEEVEGVIDYLVDFAKEFVKMKI